MWSVSSVSLSLSREFGPRSRFDQTVQCHTLLSFLALLLSDVQLSSHDRLHFRQSSEIWSLPFGVQIQKHKDVTSVTSGLCGVCANTSKGCFGWIIIFTLAGTSTIPLENSIRILPLVQKKTVSIDFLCEWACKTFTSLESVWIHSCFAGLWWKLEIHHHRSVCPEGVIHS